MVILLSIECNKGTCSYVFNSMQWLERELSPQSRLVCLFEQTLQYKVRRERERERKRERERERERENYSVTATYYSFISACVFIDFYFTFVIIARVRNRKVLDRIMELPSVLDLMRWDCQTTSPPRSSSLSHPT